MIQSDLHVDLGKSLNPSIDIGQIEGAFVQVRGWGYFLYVHLFILFIKQVSY